MSDRGVTRGQCQAGRSRFVLDDLHAFNGVIMQRTSDSNPLHWCAGFPISRGLIQYGAEPQRVGAHP